MEAKEVGWCQPWPPKSAVFGSIPTTYIISYSNAVQGHPIKGDYRALVGTGSATSVFVEIDQLDEFLPS